MTTGGAGPDWPAVEVVTASAAETRRLASRLGGLLQAGDVVLLDGPLGAGKTTFAQGLAAGLGVPTAVTSPTFVLIHEHEGRLPFYHVDLYRLSGEAESAGTGVEELLGGDGVAAVEWAGRAPGLMPAERLEVLLRPERDVRRIRVTASGARHQTRLAALAALLARAGGGER